MTTFERNMQLNAWRAQDRKEFGALITCDPRKYSELDELAFIDGMDEEEYCTLYRFDV